MTNPQKTNAIDELERLAARSDELDDTLADLRDLLMIPFTRHAYLPISLPADFDLNDEIAHALSNSYSNADFFPNAFNAPNYESAARYYKMLELLLTIDTEQLTELRLRDSLCPLHAIDYAICFDDDDPECAAIRTIHPSHDT